MQSYLCPNCGKSGVSFWRKQCLGPAGSTNCKSCGAKLSVPYSAIFAIIPFLAAIVIGQYLKSPYLVAAVVLCGISAMAYIHHKFVPLIKK